MEDFCENLYILDYKVLLTTLRISYTDYQTFSLYKLLPSLESCSQH